MSDDPRTPDEPRTSDAAAPTTAAEDETVSAVLDDEASESERSAVLADPRLRARLQVFGQLRSATADAPALDPAARDDAIARALARAPVAGGPADELAARRTAALRRRNRVLGAVAAVAVVLLAVPLLVLAFGDGGSRTEEADLAAPGGAPEPEASGDSDAIGVAAGVPVELGDVGSFADVDELRAALQAVSLTARDTPDLDAAAPSSTVPEAATSRAQAGSQTAPAGSSTAPAGSSTAPAGEEQIAVGDPASCRDAVSAAHADLGSPTAVATATLDGAPVLVLVFGGEPGTIVVADASCRTLVRDPS